jgi:hypothetical protein
MSGNLLVRFDEGRVGRTSVSPSLLLYRSLWFAFSLLPLPSLLLPGLSESQIPHSGSGKIVSDRI